MERAEQAKDPPRRHENDPLAAAMPGVLAADGAHSIRTFPPPSLSRSAKIARQIMILARLLISITGIIYLFSFWRILDFAWYGRSQLLGSVLCWSLIFCLALRAVGWGGRVLDRAL